MVYAATGGGTGSGLTCNLTETLACAYENKKRMGFNVFPYPRLYSATVEPYNTVLASSKTILSNQDISVIFDNEACYDICRRSLSIVRPSLNHLNCVIAQTTAAITTGLYDNNCGQLVDLCDF